jgi:hypothetical protein
VGYLSGYFMLNIRLLPYILLPWFRTTFSHSFMACLTPKSIMISSLPPGIAYARTSRYKRSTFSPCPPRTYDAPPKICAASRAQYSKTFVD